MDGPRVVRGGVAKHGSAAGPSPQLRAGRASSATPPSRCHDYRHPGFPVLRRTGITRPAPSPAQEAAALGEGRLRS